MSKSFEENMEELEKVVAELEKGDLNLDDSVSRFEQGIKISKECSKILEEAEKKITILVKIAAPRSTVEEALHRLTNAVKAL